jgi:hypothetical protein
MPVQPGNSERGNRETQQGDEDFAGHGAAMMAHVRARWPGGPLPPGVR